MNSLLSSSDRAVSELTDRLPTTNKRLIATAVTGPLMATELQGGISNSLFQGSNLVNATSKPQPPIRMHAKGAYHCDSRRSNPVPECICIPVSSIRDGHLF